MSNQDGDLQVALDAARAAAAVALEGWKKKVDQEDIGHKGAVDLVTEFDLRAEREAISHITARFPGDAIVAEESGESGGRADEPAPSQRVWHIDPLDGTTNFAHGFPVFGSSVALLVSGRPEVGAVVAPAMGWEFSASRGGGAFVNEKPLRVSDISSLDQALLVTGFPYSRRSRTAEIASRVEYFLGKGQGLRRIGAAALDLCFVARGWMDGYFESDLNSWDLAAGALIVIEAGGKVTGWKGEPLEQAVSTGDICATNTAIHDQMLGALREMDRSPR
jgi:myo-inositol-1(or 4)-monophosphatase